MQSGKKSYTSKLHATEKLSIGTNESSELNRTYFHTIIDLSRIPLQYIWTTAPEGGWGGHFHTFGLFLCTLTSTRCQCLLECREDLLTDKMKNRYWMHPGLHCDQPASIQWTAAIAASPHNAATNTQASIHPSPNSGWRKMHSERKITSMNQGLLSLTLDTLVIMR